MAAKTARRYGLMIAGVLLLAAACLAFVLSNGALMRGPITAYLSHRLHRTVRMETLSLGLASGRPQATFTDLRIGEPAWAGGGDLLDAPRGRIQIAWTSLFGAPVQAPLVELDRPVLRLKVDASGRANWRFGPVQSDPKPFRTFPIRQMTIRDGRIEMDDRRKDLVFSGALSTGGQDGPGGGPLVIAATGKIEGRPFRLDLKGAPISNLVQGRPYALALLARDGPTTLDAKVALATAFDLGHFTGEVSSSGQDLSALHALTGAVLPNTPPYQLSAHIARDMTRYRLTGGSGRVGRSDLAGDVLVDKVAGRRKVEADLHSQQLEFADLTAMIGAKRRAQDGTGPPSASAHTRAAAAQPRRFLLPTAPLYVRRLRSLDARVRYVAASVHSPRLPLQKLDLGVNLQGGVLAVQPLTFRFRRGVVTGRLRLDARGSAPATDLDLRVSGFHVEDLLRAQGASSPLEAPVDGYAQLHGRGLSVHETAAHLQGRVVLAFAPGSVRRRFAELIGGAGISLGRLLGPEPSQTSLRCGLVGLHGRDGRFALGPAVIDTGVATLKGSGGLDLGSEQLDVRVTGFSKRPDVLRVLAPITIAGPLARPKIEVSRATIAVQTATGVLTKLLSPLAGVLPVLKGHAAPDVDCRALLAGAP